MTESIELRQSQSGKGFLRGYGIQITESAEIFFQLAQKYGIPWTEYKIYRS